MGIVLDENIEKYTKYVKSNLSRKRYIHSVNVSVTSSCLAMAHGCDITKALTAGILHDCAKGYKHDELIKLCEKASINISSTEYASPELLHSKYGKYIAQSVFNIKDDDILNAIAYHTTGRPDMSTLEKIVFIADYIEPSRAMLKDMDLIRAEAFKDLDKAIILICKNTISYIKSKGGALDEQTLKTYEYYTNKQGDIDGIK